MQTQAVGPQSGRQTPGLCDLYSQIKQSQKQTKYLCSSFRENVLSIMVLKTKMISIDILFTFDGQENTITPNGFLLSSLITEIICFILFFKVADCQIEVTSFSHCEPWRKGRVNLWFIKSASYHLGIISQILLTPVYLFIDMLFQNCTIQSNSISKFSFFQIEWLRILLGLNQH